MTAVVCIGLCLAICSATLAGAASGPASLTEALKKGRDALAARDLKIARDAYVQALRLDGENLPALQGLAYACAVLGELDQARQAIDKSCLLPGGTDRVNALNAASIHLALGSPMRGVRAIRDYLASNPQILDAAVIDALGVLLAQVADEQVRAGGIYRDSQQLYGRLLKRLQDQHPGQERWGTQWLPAGEVQRRRRSMEAARQTVQQNTEDLAVLKEKLRGAQRDLRQAQEAQRRGTATPKPELARLQQHVQSIQEQQRQVQQELTVAQADVEPVLPSRLPLVSPLAPRPTLAVRTVPGPLEPGTRPSVSGPIPTSVALAATSQGRPAAIVPARQPPPPSAAFAFAGRNGRPRQAVAFPVAAGLLVTAMGPLHQTDRIELEGSDGLSLTAALVRQDSASGLALLRVAGLQAPHLALARSFGDGTVTCPCLPQEGLFQPVPESLEGQAASKSPGRWSVKLKRHPRLPGAPLLDGNKVVGVEAADAAIAEQADPHSLPVIPLETLRWFLAPELKQAAQDEQEDPNPAGTVYIYQVTATPQP